MYAFNYKDYGKNITYEVWDEDLSWDVLLNHFKDFLLSIGYTFPEGFTGFDAVYQEDDPQQELEL
jgi:hypothetical protein